LLKLAVRYAKKQSVLHEAEKALVLVARKARNTVQNTDLTLYYFHAESNISVKCFYLRILGGIADSEALAGMQNALNSRHPEVRDTALRELAEWPDAAALDLLEDIFKNAEEVKYRTLSMRGYLRLLATPSDRSIPQTLNLYRNAAPYAKRIDEKQQLLSGVSQYVHPEALKIAVMHLEFKGLRQMAARIAIQISSRLPQDKYQSDIVLAMSKVLALVEEPSLREQAIAIMEKVKA
jgi:hypothetical protein